MDIDLKGVSALVVDDNSMNAELLANILERYSVTAHIAGDGTEALNIAREQMPEIILLDINMPGMSGYDVCRHLKAEEQTADIPVIFISALGDMDNIVEGFDVGGVDYITKPFKYREVVARVQTQVLLARQKREIEQMREQEHQHYESMDKLRRQFIGSATHDLKNPLFIISGYTDMLEMAPDVSNDPQLLGFVQSIRRGVDKMTGLVHDILDLLQMETGVTLEKHPVDFQQFLEQVTADHVLRAKDKNIDLKLYPPDGTIQINIDQKRMERVIDNLVSNAIKYTPEGGQVEIVGKIGHHAVVIEVADTGLGIPADMLSKIFEPFERVTTEEHMAQEGTGLGLSIVQTLVEQHQGSVTVESESGRGSRFIITLPVS